MEMERQVAFWHSSTALWRTRRRNEKTRLQYYGPRLFHTGKNLVPGVGQGEGGVVLTYYSTTHQVAGAKV